MQTLAACSCRYLTLTLCTTRCFEFIDLTEHLERFVGETGFDVGMLTVQTLHTTTAVVVNEHEPLLLADFEHLLDRIVPRALPYWHDELPLRPDVGREEPRNGHAHCRALLLPTSTVLTIAGGRLRLGRWQRVFFVDFDGPRDRDVSVVAIGEPSL